MRTNLRVTPFCKTAVNLKHWLCENGLQIPEKNMKLLILVSQEGISWRTSWLTVGMQVSAVEKTLFKGIAHPKIKIASLITFTHLADAFIQSDLQCIQVIHVLSACVFPGNRTHNLELPTTQCSNHWATGTRYCSCGYLTCRNYSTCQSLTWKRRNCWIKSLFLFSYLSNGPF